MGVEKVEFLESDNKIKETKDKKNARAFNALPEHIRVQTLHKAENLYRKRAEEFEFGLAKKAETNKEILKQADEMLGKLRTMADAWAESTGQIADKVYKKSFGSNSKVLYYGAIKGTADNIKQIFDNSKSMPLRLKYGLLYRCILSGTLTKWLKTLALQILQPEMEVVSKRGKNKEVSRNFIGALQAKDKDALVSLGLLQKGKKEGNFTDQLKDIWKGISKDKQSQDGVYEFGREGALNQTKVVKQDHKLRSKNYSNLTKKDGIESFGEESLRHLRTDELSTALTPMEREALGTEGVKDGVIQGWTQGAEDNSLIHGTDTTKQVNEFKARVVAGTSGTTDLMIHAFHYFGLKPKEKKTLRMGLVGWMVGGRDHSFHEIFTAAEGYGEELKFKHDLSFIGSEYEDKDNLSPISQSDAKKILPDKEFPSYAYTPKSLIGLSSAATFHKFEETKDESEQKQKYVDGVYRRLGITEEEKANLAVPFQAFPYIDALLFNMKRLVLHYGIKKDLNQSKYGIYAMRLNREAKLDMNYIYLANTLDYNVFFEKIYKKAIKQLGLPSMFEGFLLCDVNTDKSETEALVNPQAEKTKEVATESSAKSTIELSSESSGILPPPPPPPPSIAPPSLPAQVSEAKKIETKEEREERVRRNKETYNKAKTDFEEEFARSEDSVKSLDKEGLERRKEIFKLVGGSAVSTIGQRDNVLETMKDKYEFNKNVMQVPEEDEKKLQKARDFIIEFATLDDKEEEKKKDLKEKLDELDKYFGWEYCSQLAETMRMYHGLHEFENKALNYYTKSGYQTMNKLKSSEKKMNEGDDSVSLNKLIQDHKATKALASVLKRMPKYKGTVYRVNGNANNFPTTKDGELKAPSNNDERKRLDKVFQKVSQEKPRPSSSFTSTAYDTDSTFINTYWDTKKTLNVIKNTKSGVNIAALSQFQGEHEVLFPPGVKFRTIGVAAPKDYPELFRNKKMEGHIVVEKEEV